MVPALAADWADTHCNKNPSVAVTSWTRGDAKSYAATAIGDGYDWGGGCWNSNGKDDTPAEDTYHNSVGEGPDCSGFTFKSWAMTKTGSDHKRRWELMTDEHGPYTADSFHDGAGPMTTMGFEPSYATTKKMDAFASSTHIGMIYSEGSGGSDQIIEAKDQGTNVLVMTRTYRKTPGYVGVKRQNWG
ncbi:MAG: hypothetical protein QM714_15305 [Nocardioides sp.]|uniref:hypothetical protein n=1 Tax=Nocardioides sp. TaxID=35761 RepID=UPI0039E34A42